MTITNPPQKNHSLKNKQFIDNSVQMIKTRPGLFSLSDIIPRKTGANRERREGGAWARQ